VPLIAPAVITYDELMKDRLLMDVYVHGAARIRAWIWPDGLLYTFWPIYWQSVRTSHGTEHISRFFRYFRLTQGQNRINILEFGLSHLLTGISLG
jgi:hypothetical protein